MSFEAARRDGRLLAWAGLVGVTIVLAFIVRQGVRPAGGLSLQLLDGPGGPGLVRDHAWCRSADRRAGQSARAARAAAAEVVVAGRVDRRVGTGLLLVLLPFLQTSEEQGLEVAGIPIAPSHSY